ncbi:protein RALF-like 13 [Miscanthus floridulus]|uniref:protein RALF-like 13 n=1 Tax=Miscanthus floridulus TaxID=154761 RepID=UPI00345777D3
MAVAANTARLAMVAAAVLCLLLATEPQEAAGADQGQYLSYDKVLSCKALGNCEKNQGPEDKRPGKPANDYTRGCSKIFKCRG